METAVQSKEKEGYDKGFPLLIVMCYIEQCFMFDTHFNLTPM